MVLENIYALAENKMLISAALAWAIAQGFKIITYWIINKKLDFMQIFAAGGMPSSHTALMTALTTSAIKIYGLSSPFFAVSFCMMCIVMYDAAGVRRQAGEQASVINLIVEEWEKNYGEITDKNLKEIIGHTPFEVFGGLLVGVLTALVV